MVVITDGEHGAKKRWHLSEDPRPISARYRAISAV